MERHCCRVCGLSFPTGRSLGGHMRSHVMLSSPMEDEYKPESRYGLRDNPKKSQRFDDAWPEKVNDNVRAKSSKFCPLLNSSLGMSRDELNHEEGGDLWSNRSYEEEAGEMLNQTYREVTVIPIPVKKHRRRSPRKVAINSTYSTPLALPPEYANEEEIGALCLLMLSRGTYSIPNSPDKMSPIIEFRNKVRSFPSEDEEQQFKKQKISSLSRNGDHGNVNSLVLKIGKRSLSNQCDLESEMHNSCKRRRYACAICNKSFPSYQALGGHRTSHKKMKGDHHELTDQKCDSQTIERSPEIFKSHDCSICGRKFLTGQALGGHKRSHLVATDNSTSIVVVSTAGKNSIHPSPVLMEIEQKVSMLNSIDLNLPAHDTDC